MIDKIRSKYQAKNYEEIEYELEEIVCRKCDRPYMVDSRFLQTTIKDDEDWEIRICPYCGFKAFVCI